MKLSHRITHINDGGSDGWDVFVRGRRMAAAGLPVTELTIGEHDVRTAPIILRAMYDAAMAGHTGYAMIPGTDGLRDGVATRVTERTGVPTTRDNVLITAGGQAALFAAHHAVCDEGDTALYIDPYYATYPGTIRAVGAKAVAIPSDPATGFQPAAEDIAAMADNAKSLLINSPNNPTGAIYTAETLTAVADVCKAQDLWLISDEVYDTQVWDSDHLTPRSLPDMAERTLVIGSMSKSHAMTGSRCGWIVGPEEVIAHAINLSTCTNYGVSGFIQDAALFALNQGHGLEEKIAAPFHRRRDLALKTLAGQNVVGCVSPQGAMYLMLDIRATGMTGNTFANALLDMHNIAVMPGESFGHAAAGFIRVAMTVDDAAFVAALQTLCAFAETRAKTHA
ncbi:MAG: pyridoxal phosphate-dependent aminotransferase [Marinibacterium sp.]|nr:pyridoxal phosphate-dependent aminotransferase [Marinibacterium sp.]